MQEYPWYLDLLRNEGPITARVQDPAEVDGASHPNFLVTSQEAVSEGDIDFA
jgi:hypothetical protein